VTVDLMAGIAVLDHERALAWFSSSAVRSGPPGMPCTSYRDPEGNEIGIGGGPA
jgi:hypothetical protein